MNADLERAVDLLALYFTDHNVAHHSTNLQLNGTGRKPAEDYFKVRRAFGVQGYASVKEAKAGILRTLEKAPSADNKTVG